MELFEKEVISTLNELRGILSDVGVKMAISTEKLGHIDAHLSQLNGSVAKHENVITELQKATAYASGKTEGQEQSSNKFMSNIRPIGLMFIGALFALLLYMGRDLLTTHSLLPLGH